MASKKKGKKKKPKKIGGTGGKFNDVNIRYVEYKNTMADNKTRIKVEIDPIVIPLYKKGAEQVRWIFSAKGTSAICRVRFNSISPFTGLNPSPGFGPGVGSPEPAVLDSGALATNNTGRYKYQIEIVPSSPGFGGTIVIDPEVDVWDDSPPPDEDY
jgi:hypothetical protein